jgi:hypothetical protein
MSGHQRHRCLPDATRTDDRDKSSEFKLKQQILHDFVTADNFRWMGGQGSGGVARRRRAAVSCAGRGLQLADEAVAPTRHSHDEPFAPFPVAQRSAQRDHVEAKSGFDDHGVRPDTLKQFPLVYHFAGPLRENGKNVHRAAREFDDHSAALEPSQTGRELELAETQTGPKGWRAGHRGTAVRWSGQVVWTSSIIGPAVRWSAYAGPRSIRTISGRRARPNRTSRSITTMAANCRLTLPHDIFIMQLFA